MTLDEWKTIKPGMTIYGKKGIREVIRFNPESLCASLKPIGHSIYNSEAVVYSKNERQLFSLVPFQRVKINMNTSDFKEKLKQIDNGRFTNVLEPLHIQDECFKCYYLNPKITDPREGYRCCCVGSCIAATLSTDLKSYLFWKLNEITEEQHLRNVKEERFFKINQ